MLRRCKRSLSMIRDLSKKGKVKGGDKEAAVVQSVSGSLQDGSRDAESVVSEPVILSISTGSDSSVEAEVADANNNR